jgi:hypothetical protein
MSQEGSHAGCQPHGRPHLQIARPHAQQDEHQKPEQRHANDPQDELAGIHAGTLPDTSLNFQRASA